MLNYEHGSYTLKLGWDFMAWMAASYSKRSFIHDACFTRVAKACLQYVARALNNRSAYNGSHYLPQAISSGGTSGSLTQPLPFTSCHMPG